MKNRFRLAQFCTGGFKDFEIYAINPYTRITFYYVTISHTKKFRRKKISKIFSTNLLVSWKLFSLIFLIFWSFCTLEKTIVFLSVLARGRGCHSIRAGGLNSTQDGTDESPTPRHDSFLCDFDSKIIWPKLKIVFYKWRQMGKTSAVIHSPKINISWNILKGSSLKWWGKTKSCLYRFKFKSSIDP